MTSGYLVYFYPYEVVGQSLLFTGSNYPHALLHSPEMPDRFLLDMQLELASCKSGSFKFGIVSENPLYSELRRSFRWEVLVFFRNRTGAERFLFGGYPVQRETDIYGITTFTCDGVMGYLDTLQGAKTAPHVSHHLQYGVGHGASGRDYTGYVEEPDGNGRIADPPGGLLWRRAVRAEDVGRHH